MGLGLTQPGLRVAVEEAYGAVLAVQARRDRLDAAIAELAATPPWAAVVARLGCLRGVGVLTGFGLAVEIGDWQRFTGVRIGAWLGLVPGEQSSGGRRSHGSITKTGNTHARRLLVEAAWHHRKPYRPSRELRARQDRQPAVVRERADRGNRRLHQRWCRLDARASAPPSVWSRSPASLPAVLEPGRPGRLTQHPQLAGGAAPPARGATRDTPMSSQAAATPRVTLDL